ncbi:MAG: Fructose-2,6-bisphosphatase, partial [Actinobacteria bacterium 66_15]
MSAVREILVARHPETVANRELRFVGSGDSPYTPRGAQQRDALAAHIASWAPAALYVSPLPRARAVAEVVDPAGALTTVLDDLRELDFGEAEGLTWEEIEARGIPITRLGPGPVARGGEAVEVFGERVARASAAIVDGHGRTAVVTHAG